MPSVRPSVRPSVPRAERSRSPRAPSLSLSLRALVPSNKCTFSKGLESPIPGSGMGGGGAGLGLALPSAAAAACFLPVYRDQ